MSYHTPPPDVLDYGDPMTGEEMRDARGELGRRWGFGRPLKMSEMERACRLRPQTPGVAVRDYERGKTVISGPLSALIDCYLAGALPPDGLDVVRAAGDAGFD